MKKYLSELSFDEIKKVLENNSDLWDKTLERAVDDGYFWLEEYLYGANEVGGLDWSIGYNRGDYFHIKELTADVLDWIESSTKTYGLFDDKLVKDAEKCYAMYKFLNYSYEDTFEGKSEEEVEDEYEELKEDLAGRIYDRLVSEISYWYDTPNSKLVDDLADIFDSYMDDIVDDSPKYIMVDTETGEFIEDDPFDEDEDEDEYPGQLRLPGFED